MLFGVFFVVVGWFFPFSSPQVGGFCLCLVAVAPRLNALFLWLVGLPRGPLLSERAVGPSVSVTGEESHMVLAPGVLRIDDCSGKQMICPNVARLRDTCEKPGFAPV